ncbi:MAG: hypothetical protein GX483_07415 [Actinomycetaceae bacterium]|nr:hypothetical protein [Actinomycetaceae bacterium]
MKRLLAGGLAGAVSTGVRAVAKAKPLPSWDRKSYSGSTVSLTGGLQAGAGALVGACIGAQNGGTRAGSIANVSGAVAGYIDDHLEDSFPARGKGFRGHLGALKNGQVTSGLLKIGVIGLGSLVSAAVLAQQRGTHRCVNTVVDSLLIASTANLVNLLDLRPGRALKVTAAGALPVALSSSAQAHSAAGIVGSSLAALPADLRGETMLGDLGANAVGAQLGVVLAGSLPLPARLVALTTTIGLTAASEKISFSQVIDENPVLSWIDNLGR